MSHPGGASGRDLARRLTAELETRRRADVPAAHRRARAALNWTLLAASALLAVETVARLTWHDRAPVSAAEVALMSARSMDALNRRFGGGPDTAAKPFRTDAATLWTLVPGSRLAGQPVAPGGFTGDGAGATNRPGLAAADTRRTNIRVVRMTVLGDSVPVVSGRPFPRLVERLSLGAEGSAADAPGSGTSTIRAVVAAVPGHSTEQGLVRQRQSAAAIGCDVALLCFGVSDGRPALGHPDHELLAAADSPTSGGVSATWRLPRWWKARRSGEADGVGADDDRTVRVSPARFRANLATMARRAAGAGARLVVIVVEPGAPAAYATESRRAARECGAALLDLEEEFRRRDRGRLMLSDGVHLSPAGHNAAARMLLALLRDRGVLTAAEVDRMAAAARYDSAAPDRMGVAWSLAAPLLEASTTAPAVALSLLARNTGNTRWLKAVEGAEAIEGPARLGGVSVTGRWRTTGAPVRLPGAPPDTPDAAAPLPADLLPGESTSITMTLAPPPAAGLWEMEIGLSAAGVGDLSPFGAEATTVTVRTVRP